MGSGGNIRNCNSGSLSHSSKLLFTFSPFLDANNFIRVRLMSSKSILDTFEAHLAFRTANQDTTSMNLHHSVVAYQRQTSWRDD